MPIWQFPRYTTAGSALWNTILIGAGWLLGDQWTLVRDYAQYLGYAALFLLAVGLAWSAWKRKQRRSSGHPQLDR